MNSTPLSNRLHIGIFGRRNVGKSSLINALTGQAVAIVSELPGTTTDPVHKAMEIHEIGPVVVIDTGGLDDAGAVGAMRVKSAYKVLAKTDVALLVADRSEPLGPCERDFINEIEARRIPVIIVVNKTDEGSPDNRLMSEISSLKLHHVCTSALTGKGMAELRGKIVECTPNDYERKTILSDLLSPGSLVLMVAPLDMEAPKGRLKLPQVQTIRDILDNNCSVLMTKETGLERELNTLRKPPDLVITESQVLSAVGAVLPPDIPLTTFSILYARYKCEVDTLLRGAEVIDELTPASKVLVAEACTHHPIGDDIGKVVIPGLLNSRFPGISIEHVSGFDFPASLDGYSLVIHCGGCMINRREMMGRMAAAAGASVPITNYGLFLAHMHGMLDRVTAPFGRLAGMTKSIA